MKRIISGMFAMIMLVALFSNTALAQNYEDTSTGYANASTSAASVSESITLTVNGIDYAIPGGATSTVGYGYNNNYTYVYLCQVACNWMYNATWDSMFPCYSDCGVVDGAFGPNTYSGILGFQKYNNTRMAGWPRLTEDGICGDGTWTRLADLCN